MLLHGYRIVVGRIFPACRRRSYTIKNVLLLAGKDALDIKSRLHVALCDQKVLFSANGNAVLIYAINEKIRSHRVHGVVLSMCSL